MIQINIRLRKPANHHCRDAGVNGDLQSGFAVRAGAGREEITNHCKEEVTKPIRAWSPASGRPALASTRVLRNPAAAASKAGTYGAMELAGGGEQAPTAQRRFPAGARRLPMGPSFPQKRGGGRGVSEESDTNPTSCPERDFGGPAITIRVPRANSRVSPDAGKEEVPARGRS